MQTNGAMSLGSDLYQICIVCNDLGAFGSWCVISGI